MKDPLAKAFEDKYPGVKVEVEIITDQMILTLMQLQLILEQEQMFQTFLQQRQLC